MHRSTLISLATLVLLSACGASTPTPDPSDVMTLTLPGGVEMVLVHVPAGEFLMGTVYKSNDVKTNEHPQHKVTLSEYWIGKYEVTNAQYAVNAKAKGLSWSRKYWTDSHPAVDVSWDDAVAFCGWLSEFSQKQVRLPTEAEWEKAARGTDGRIYPWGNQPPDSRGLNFYNKGVEHSEVGKYSPAGDSPYGAADMAGSVWEWTADWYASYEQKYYDTVSDLTGPASGQQRVVRGGSRDLIPSYMWAAKRNYHDPSYRVVYIGFRVAMSAPVQ